MPHTALENTPDSRFAIAHRHLCELCDHFDAQREHVLSPAYKEAHARDEFITPFFEALGWDVRNTAHRSVYEKDVVIEKRENISGTARSADYAFRRPGSHLTSFFVEAKKPSVDIRRPAECYQAILYGWNAKTPLVILTDFEQFLILDSRSEPHLDTAARHVLKQNGSYTYRDYRDPEKFAELWGLFARENVAAGSLDKAAAALPRLSGRIQRDDIFARGTAPVDETFLAEMELWREKLAKSLKRTNHDLDGERLTALTQRILDRLVFLRFLEDRGIERDITFASLGKSGSAWRDFLKVSRRLDSRYNGIIYKKEEHGCEETTLVVDDPTFAAIASKFAPENSKYLFNSISVTILGSIYERFLGNVIVAKNKTADVEPKPDVRKAGGVYYTPDYIVRYIVEQTVGRCIADKSPKEIERLRFADIACGSGSFLVEVFASLIRYHLAWYLADDAKKWEKKNILRTREIDGDYVLTLAEKRRILLANVYGVDLDPQAVAVTQLSLYLRLMEDESFPSTQLLFDEEHKALLPDLRENIICGNSLIEADIADLFGLTPEEEEKIRPLDFRWQFPKVFNRRFEQDSRVEETADKYIMPGADPTHGAMAKSEPRSIKAKSSPIHENGFDAIVGNPPYILLQDEFRDPIRNDYIKRKYKVASYKLDTYHLFFERALSLLRPNGLNGYITPTNYLTNNHLANLRRFLLTESQPLQIVVFQGQVFVGASVDTAISILERSHKKKRFTFATATSQGPLELTSEIKIDPAVCLNDPHVLITPAMQKADSLLSKMEAVSIPLGSLCDVNFGKQLRDRKKFTNDVISVPNKAVVPKTHVACVTGKDVTRYHLSWSGLACLNNRIAQSGGCWDEDKHNAKPKLLTRQIGKHPTFCCDTVGYHCLNTIFMVTPRQMQLSLLYILGILNSRLLAHYWKTRFFDQRQTFPKIKGTYLKELPIRRIDLGRSSDKTLHDKLVKLVERMLIAKNELELNKSRHEHWLRQCEVLERQIDALVYELYGFTEEKIAFVEDNP